MGGNGISHILWLLSCNKENGPMICHLSLWGKQTCNTNRLVLKKTRIELLRTTEVQAWQPDESFRSAWLWIEVDIDGSLFPYKNPRFP